MQRNICFSAFAEATHQVYLVMTFNYIRKWLETKVTVLQWVCSWNPENNMLKMGGTAWTK